jgi:hypothetical protein
MGERNYSFPRIRNLGTRWRRVDSFTPRHPLETRLGGTQSHPGLNRNTDCIKNMEPGVAQNTEKATGWTTGVPLPVGGETHYPRHRAQTCSETHPAQHPTGIGDPSLGAKQSGYEVAAKIKSYEMSRNVPDYRPTDRPN